MNPEHLEKDHQKQLIGDLDNFRKNNTLTDIVLKCEGGQVPAHRLILSATSPYFKSLFNGGGTTQKEVELAGIKVDVLEIIVEFAYSGEVPVNLCNDVGKIQELIMATDYLQMQQFQDFCWKLLLQNLTPDNFMETLLLADNYGNEEGQCIIVQYIRDNFEEINKDGQVVELSTKHMSELVPLLKECQPSEVIMTAILDWAKHNPDGRRTDLLVLCNEVDMGTLSDEYLHNLPNTEPLVKESVELLQMLLAAATSRLLKKDGISVPESPKSPSQRSSTASRKKSLSFDEGGSDDTLKFNYKLHFFRTAPDYPPKVLIHSYTPALKTWTDERSLPEEITPDFLACGLGCCLYFFSCYYQCVILYYPEDGRYKEVTRSCPVTDCIRIAEHRNKIYIWGETAFVRFNPGVKKWESLAPLRGHYQDCYFISTFNNLFLRNSANTSLYCYNVFANQWYLKTVHPAIKYSSSCAPFDGKLYFYTHSEIYVFDPDDNKWDVTKPPMGIEKLGKSWSHLSVSQEWPFFLFQDEREQLWRHKPTTGSWDKFSVPQNRSIADWVRCVLTTETKKCEGKD